MFLPICSLQRKSNRRSGHVLGQDRRGIWSEKVREWHFRILDIIFKWPHPACMASVRSAILLNALTPGRPLPPRCTVSYGTLPWRKDGKNIVFLWTIKLTAQHLLCQVTMESFFWMVSSSHDFHLFYVWMYVLMCSCIHVHMFIWRPEVNIW